MAKAAKPEVLFPGDSEMAQRMRTFDWTSSAAGSPAHWPESLRTAVRICLGSPDPIMIWWERSELVQFYNDGFIPLLGRERHPALLGRNARDSWTDIGETLGAGLDRVFATGDATRLTALNQALDRNNPRDNGDFVFSCSPIWNEAGVINGILCHGHATSARANEERLRLALSVGELATWDWDMRTGAVIWSREHYIMQGYAVGEIEPSFEAWIARVHPEDRISAVAAIETARDQQVPYHHEFRSQLPDGTVRRLSGRGVFFYDPQGEAVRMIGVMRDVTEQREAEEALRKSEARQAFLLQLSDALRPLADPLEAQFVAMSLLGKWLQIDHAFYYRSERDGEDWVQVVEGSVFRAPDVPAGPARRRQADFGKSLFAPLARGETVVVDDIEAVDGLTPAQRENFRQAHVRSCAVVPLMIDGCYVAGVWAQSSAARKWTGEEMGMIREVAERTWAADQRTRAEAALRESEERYRTLFEGIDEGFCIIEVIFDGARPVDYRFLEVNPAFERHTGIARAQGRRMLEIAPEHEQHWIDYYGEIALTGEPRRLEAPALALGNRWFDLNAFRVGEPHQRRVAVLFNDVTQRRRDALTLRESEERLREIDRRKNHFLAILGHELRNPLAAIHAGLLLLASPKAKPESKERALPTVLEQTAHMERLVDDLLEVTRIVQGRITLQKEPMALQDALRQALDMCRAKAESGGFEIATDIPAEPLQLDGDSVRLTQVFVNIIGNAMKYSGDSRRIGLAAAREDRMIVVRVRDHGEGISPELLPRVFDPFVQARPGLTLDAGMGMGLAVVKELVRLHGGEAEALSQGPNQGSEFVVRLPAV